MILRFELHSFPHSTQLFPRLDELSMQHFQALRHQIMLSWSQDTLRTVCSVRRYADSSQDATHFRKFQTPIEHSRTAMRPVSLAGEKDETPRR